MATKTAIRARLRQAKNAAERLQEDVDWLVAERAWEILGYNNFSEMWMKENGFEPSTHIQVLAISSLAKEGMNVVRGPGNKTGHTRVDVAKMIGISIHLDSRNGNLRSPMVDGILSQLREGIPPERVIKDTRKRSRPRRIGKLANEYVPTSLYLRKWCVDEVAEIARASDVPNAEIYRQAIEEFLSRARKK
jgi:hypothetical protein